MKIRPNWPVIRFADGHSAACDWSSELINYASGLFALWLASAAGASTIVTNGSFETGVPANGPGLYNGAIYADMPGYGGWDVWSEINGWKTVSGDGIEAQTDGTIGEVDAQDGNYYLEMDAAGNSTMQQVVSLLKGSYLLSFWYSPRTWNEESNGVVYTLGDLVDGFISGPSERQGTAVGGWTQITTLFTVETVGDYALRFGGYGTSDGYGGLIDNVSIEVAAVPLPAAGLFLLGGLGGVAALKRRRA